MGLWIGKYVEKGKFHIQNKNLPFSHHATVGSKLTDCYQSLTI